MRRILLINLVSILILGCKSEVIDFVDAADIACSCNVLRIDDVDNKCGDFDHEVEILVKNITNISGENKIVFVGSSSIKRWKNLSDLNSEVTIFNHGFGGSTMCDLLYYLDELVINVGADKVFIYEGDNDIVLGLSNDQIVNSLRLIVASLKSSNPDQKIFILSPKPSWKRWEYKEVYLDLISRYSDLCREQNLGFIDLWWPMLEETGQINQIYFEPDSLHLSKVGYSVWEDIIAPYLQ